MGGGGAPVAGSKLAKKMACVCGSCVAVAISNTTIVRRPSTVDSYPCVRVIKKFRINLFVSSRLNDEDRGRECRTVKYVVLVLGAAMSSCCFDKIADYRSLVIKQSY